VVATLKPRSTPFTDETEGSKRAQDRPEAALVAP